MNKFDKLESLVLKLGEYSKKNQENIDFTFKEDGTILTQTDTFISTSLIDFFTKEFPDCSIISEEKENNIIKDGPYIFVIDPIDGTDMYSQGLCSYCISIGILDSKTRIAIGCLIFAPRFGLASDSLLLRLDPNSNNIYLNHKVYNFNLKKDDVTCITMGSNMSYFLNQDNIKDIKIRSFGSNVIHMLLCMLSQRITCSLSPRCYVWDLASTNALANKIGYITCYKDGSIFTYDDLYLLKREKIKDILYCGPKHLFAKAKSKLK